ncbi:hypothetical protein [Nocardioides lianchengensis]|uniref:Uncharacterized protein n=1 Tax=Nocardioides lianchengensis TaxID=1045774 RepID=A0A1G6ITT5_9ACTN|nr:hypothetical protein [Nocardioides lianchengensis]NYG12957.1 hypothetical protein [Nocardioides lianchengensis]SDC09455.1 hypothetical protein SAMN05421872_101269 [Nocardioides lianchengensis]
MTSARRPILLLAGALAAVLTISLLSPSGSASASASERRGGETVSRSYSSYRYVDVPQFGFCLGVYATARLQATYKRRPISQGVVSELRDPKIIDPSLQVTVKRSCDDDAKYRKKHRANKISYSNYYYGYKCSFDPSFSAGAPWTVGVGITPDCGSEKVAKVGEVNGRARRAYRFVLDTEGYAFGWDGSDSVVEPGSVKLCTSLSGYFRMKDSQGAERQTVAKKVSFPDLCLTK